MIATTAAPPSAAAAAGGSREERAWHVLRSVMDPEIPVLSVVDLGVIRHVRAEATRVRVGITPTYSGCPATEVIASLVREALERAALGEVVIETVLSPPWTSEWVTAQGRRKLEAFGIAPPSAREAAHIACPRCGSHHVERLSEFGSTPCKAHCRCGDCLEPFDVFKCI